MTPDEQNDLLIKMSSKVDDIHDEIKGTPARPGLLTRVDDLEGWRDTSKGWIAGAVAALTALAGAFGWHIFKH